MKKVSGYCRVSSLNQLDGSSLEVQQQQIAAYCTMKGFQLVNIYVDSAISGGVDIDLRPEGSKLMQSIRTGEVQGMVIAKLDRAFRAVVDCLQTCDELDKLKVSLHIIDLGGSSVDSQTPAGRFMLTVLAAAAEMEKGQIKQRCNTGRAQHKAEHKRIGEIPVGYDLAPDGETLIENVQEQEAIALVQELRSRGETLKAIAHRLDTAGYKPKKGGSVWTTNMVNRILMKRAA